MPKTSFSRKPLKLLPEHSELLAHIMDTSGRLYLYKRNSKQNPSKKRSPCLTLTFRCPTRAHANSIRAILKTGTVRFSGARWTITYTSNIARQCIAACAPYITNPILKEQITLLENTAHIHTRKGNRTPEEWVILDKLSARFAAIQHEHYTSHYIRPVNEDPPPYDPSAHPVSDNPVFEAALRIKAQMEAEITAAEKLKKK